MNITLMAAVGSKGEIGLKNTIPWRLKDDMRRFKDTTMGKIVIMGRKTFESIPVFLDGRTVIVMTRKVDLVQAHVNMLKNKFQGKQVPPIICMDSLEALFDALDDIISLYDCNTSEVIIAGGSTIYKEFAPYADKLILTIVKTPDDFEADSYFPNPSNIKEWRRIENVSYKKNENNEYDYEFLTLVRDKKSRVYDFKSKKELSKAQKIYKALTES